MDRQTTLRSTIATKVSSPRTNPRSRLRRAGVLVGGLAFAAVAAFGTSTPAFADDATWGVQDVHDQGVVCNFQTHTISVYPAASAFDSFPNGQLVASRIIRRDVTANGGWISTSWQQTLVNSWTFIPGTSLSDPMWLNPRKPLPSLTFSAYKDHTYSVYVDYYYANANRVYTWDDMHATSSYETITSSGLHHETTTCQAGF